MPDTHSSSFDYHYVCILILTEQHKWHRRHWKGNHVSDFDKGYILVTGLEGVYQSAQQAAFRKDSGGETYRGIARKKEPNWDGWKIIDLAKLGSNFPDCLDANQALQDSAKNFYQLNYWDMVKADQMPFPLNVFVFDAGVNQGTQAAIKLLQKTLNQPQDGIIGMQTIAKAQAANTETMALYMADRSLRYTGTRNFDLDGRGWLKRLFLITMEVK